MTVLPESVDRTIVSSFVWHWNVTDGRTDKQTDGRTDMPWLLQRAIRTRC